MFLLKVTFFFQILILMTKREKEPTGRHSSPDPLGPPIVLVLKVRPADLNRISAISAWQKQKIQKKTFEMRFENKFLKKCVSKTRPTEKLKCLVHSAKKNVFQTQKKTKTKQKKCI